MVTREGCKLRMQLKKYKPPKQRAVASVNRELLVLRHMFSKAFEWAMIERSPFTGAKGLFYKENNQRKRYLSDEEETRLLNQCDGLLKKVVTLALNTGMRRGEIMGLKWEQIRNGFIYITESKSNKAREIPINATLKSLLESIPHYIGSPYVFHRKKDGSPYADLTRGFEAAVKRAELNDFRFHDLRHTFASKLVMRGAGLKVVQELLGHSNILMTMRYSHLADSAKVKSVMLLDELEGEKENSYNLATIQEKSTYSNSVSAQFLVGGTGLEPATLCL